MKRQTLINTASASLLMLVWAQNSVAVDLESFEFNDGGGTSLATAANTANPGNQWVEDAQMFPSDVRNGAFNLTHESTVLESNYLQINNVASGSVYLTARMSGWKFGSTLDPANLEEVRFGILNDDTAPTFGSTITAQMMLRRNAAGNVELVGDALGTGSANIAGTAVFASTRNAPLTVVLEFNATSNSYKVFYKDNANATQVLGLGTVAATRDGNSLRFATNNSFGEGNGDYPVVPADEIFSIDRLALSDTNPFNDLITLEIDRDNGAMTLRNSSGAAINGIESYTIASTAGGLNPAGWSPIAGGANSSSNTELMQTFGVAINLTNGQSTVLSNVSGAWLKSPFEDLSMVLNLSGGATRTVNVNFIDNGGERFAVGDLSADGNLTAADYVILTANAETSLAGLSVVEQYRKGDLGGDGFNSIEDFVQFKSLYDDANGTGAFQAMVSSVPEPGSIALFGSAIAVASCVLGRRNRPEPCYSKHIPASPIFANPVLGVSCMPRARNLLLVVVATLASLFGVTAAKAAILEDFLFNEANGTELGDTQNSANAGNQWLVHANTVESATFNGSYRINKQTATAQAANVLDIANITSGKAWLVTEMAGWNYTATPSSPSERLRFGFLDSTDPPTTGSSTITAEANIDRDGSGLILRGDALGTGSTSPLPGTLALPLVRTTPFALALELDKSADRYSLYYKDNAAAFQLLGSGNLGASTLNAGARDGNSIRFAFTGTFGDTGEFVDINRMYLTDTSPIDGPVVPVTLALEVRSNGQVYIKNPTANPISFDSYRIASGSNSLNEAGWNSLAEQGIDPFMGGNDAGELWTEAGGSNDAVLAESFLLSASTLNPGAELVLGSAYKVGGLQDLTFQYRDSVSLAVPSVLPTYVTVAGVAGDYNSDGAVNAADYTIWRDHFNQSFQLSNEGGVSPGVVNQADYDFWKSRFGATTGAGAGSLSAVPEPSFAVLAIGFMIGAAFVRSQR